MLLANKLKLPPLEENLLPRDSLGKRFAKFREYKITTLTTPAGYGKSVFVAQQLEQLALPIAWVTLDKEDNHSRLFWTYVTASLQSIDERITRRTQTLLNAAQETEISNVVTVLLDELKHYQRNWTCPESITLVFDDFQRITDHLLLEQINLFLDHLPRYLHCVILSRTQPSVHLGRRLSKNQLLHFTQQDFQLSLEETQQLLSRTNNRIFSAKEIKQLHEKSEGWLGALQLLSFILEQNQTRVETLLLTPGSDLILSDYLASEVIKQTQPEFLGQLFNLSCLPRFNEELLRTLSGSEKTDRIWKQLNQESVLVTTFQHSPGWFRIHRLIAQWLLSHNQPPADNKEFLHLAASWFYEKELHLDALELSIQCEAWDIAIAVVYQAAPELFRQGKYAMAGELIAKIPAHTLSNHPKMALIKILVERNSHGLQAAINALQSLEVLLATLSTATIPTLANHGIHSLQELQDIQTQTSLIQADIARYTGSYQLAADLTLGIEKSELTKNRFFGGWILTSLGADELLKGNIEAAYSTLIRALEISKENNDGLCFLVTICWLGPLLVLRGQLHTAIEFLDSWQQWIEDKGFDVIALSSVIDRTRVFVYREMNDLNKAATHLEKMEWAFDDLDPINKVYSHWAKVSLSLTSPDTTRSLTDIDKLEVIYHRYFTQWNFAIPDLHCLRGLVNLKQGNPGPLLQWAQSFEENVEGKNYLQFITEENIMVRIKIELGQEMSSTISQLRQSAQEKGMIQREVYSYLLDTLNANKQGKINTAQKTLQRALEIASSYGFIRMFIEEALALAPIMNKFTPSETIAPLYHEILATLTPPTNQETNTTTPQPTPIAEEHSLSPREYEVLKLMVEGSTNRQIAEQLSISDTTVKSHLRNIYGKLGVKRRTQAMAEARARHWI